MATRTLRLTLRGEEYADLDIRESTTPAEQGNKSVMASVVARHVEEVCLILLVQPLDSDLPKIAEALFENEKKNPSTPVTIALTKPDLLDTTIGPHQQQVLRGISMATSVAGICVVMNKDLDTVESHDIRQNEKTFFETKIELCVTIVNAQTEKEVSNLEKVIAQELLKQVKGRLYPAIEVINQQRDLLEGTLEKLPKPPGTNIKAQLFSRLEMIEIGGLRHTDLEKESSVFLDQWRRVARHLKQQMERGAPTLELSPSTESQALVGQASLNSSSGPMKQKAASAFE